MMIRSVLATVVCALCFLLGCEAGAPKFLCDNDQTSYVGESDVNITCSVMGSPAVDPEDMSVWWYTLGDPDNETDPSTLHRASLNGGQSFSHYRAVSKEGGDHEAIMELFIDRVFPQAFRTYYFVANNTHGSSEHPVVFLRDKSKEPTAAATHMVLSIVMATVIALLHLSTH